MCSGFIERNRGFMVCSIQDSLCHKPKVQIKFPAVPLKNVLRVPNSVERTTNIK